MQMTLIEREDCSTQGVHSWYTRIDTKRDFPPFLVGDGKPPNFDSRTVGQSDRVCRMCHT